MEKLPKSNSIEEIIKKHDLSEKERESLDEVLASLGFGDVIDVTAAVGKVVSQKDEKLMAVLSDISKFLQNPNSQ